ncbi:MAG: NRDE family protein [Janthinobacterium lividum]
MCLIVFDWDTPKHAGHATEHALPRNATLVLAANRDEFYRRPSLPMHWWPAEPDMPDGQLLAGRDRLGGGTWMGITRDGRFAAVTNFRGPPRQTSVPLPSRGDLVVDFLRGARLSPLDYLSVVAQRGDQYNGFNLLVGDLFAGELAWYGNKSDDPPALLAPGVYGLSNALLDTPWPKVIAKKAAMLNRSAEPQALLERLVETMRDPTPASDDAIPTTGLTLERERAFSAAFIETTDYGTRSTAAMDVRADGAVSVLELSDDEGEGRTRAPPVARRFAFSIEAPAA